VLKTFSKGGVHPKENKISTGCKITQIEVPKQACIFVSQHIGAPAEPIVTKGDFVKVGQIIAKAKGFVSANIHSSVSGTVVKIDKAIDVNGYKQTAIFIDTDGDQWLDTIDKSDEIKFDFQNKEIEEIKAKITESGLVGSGGATFPTHVKISIPEGKVCEHLIINAVECEPYLTADHQLMLEHPEEIMIGCKLVQKITRAKKVLIGIENNKQDAVKLLSEVAKKYPDIEVFALKVKYPQGAEKQLIKSLVNREVPSGKLPIEVGCVVQNVGTIFSIYEAVMKNKPFFERVVTVTGKSLTKQSNILARIGTPINLLIEAAGGIPENTGKIIGGGPMMGKALVNEFVPVTKGTSGILLMPKNQSTRPQSCNCIRCGKCMQACPMGLEPYLLKNLSVLGMFEEMQTEHVLDCVECGCCSFTCPAGIPLLDHIRLGKATVNKMLRDKK
jgi:electron transport complex protein RnfC